MYRKRNSDFLKITYKMKRKISGTLNPSGTLSISFLGLKLSSLLNYFYLRTMDIYKIQY